MFFGLDITNWGFLFEVQHLCIRIMVFAAILLLLCYILIRFAKKDMLHAVRLLNLVILVAAIIGLLSTSIIIFLLGDRTINNFMEMAEFYPLLAYINLFSFFTGLIAPLLLLAKKFRNDLNFSVLMALLIISTQLLHNWARMHTISF